MKLNRQIEQMDRDIEVNPQFVKKTLGLQVEEDLSMGMVAGRSLRSEESYVM
jgi:hypothetical protein